MLAANPKISPPKGNRRKQVKRACSNCRSAHAGCDNQRPCSRCISKGLTDYCQEWTEEDARNRVNSQREQNGTATILQKRSRDQICSHGWDTGDPSLLSQLISHDFSYSTFPFMPSQPQESVVLKTSGPEEIYTHICLPHEECQLCKDCQEDQQAQKQNKDIFGQLDVPSPQLPMEQLPSSGDSIPTEPPKIPNIPEYLPHHKLEFSSLPDTAIQKNHATAWYQFTAPIESKPTSIWLIKQKGRSDDWTIVECNQAFIDLIQIPVTSVSSAYTMMDLVPQRFKASTSELLQQIINSNVNNATAKSLWKKGNTETCVSSTFRIYQIPKQRDKSSNCEPMDYSILGGFDHPMPDQIQNWGEYPSAKSCCETTGCGAFRTDWVQQKKECQKQEHACVCGDTAPISNSERESDRIVIAVHEEVDFYDDFIRIGDKTHEKTFSIQVATIIALASNSSMSIKPKSQRLKS